MKFSYRSKWSLASVASMLCVLSIGSFGSVGSVLSIGSMSSILSVASSASVLSIGSNGCVLSLFKDCVNTPTPVVEITLRVDEQVFDKMALCSKDEYNSENRPEKCEYQDAIVTYVSVGMNVTAKAKLRQKGSSTFTSMYDKAAFKVKDMEKDGKPVEFGRFECKTNSNQVCPPGKDYNVWKSDRFTLNNNAYPQYYTKNGEVDAYIVFRDIGKVAVPYAQYAKVTLMRGESVIRTDTYAMIETISDNNFLEKWFGYPFYLWEVDAGEVEYKRGKTESGEKVKTSPLDESELLHLDRDELNGTPDMIKYYLGEVFTQHWDGACQRPLKNNHYLAWHYPTTPPTDHPITTHSTNHVEEPWSWTIIPSGLDNTFQACVHEAVKGPDVSCGYMAKCLLDSVCRSTYMDEKNRLSRLVHRKAQSCKDELLPVWTAIIGILAWSCIVYAASGARFWK